MTFLPDKRAGFGLALLGILTSLLPLYAAETLQLRLHPRHAYPGEPVVATLRFHSDASRPVDRIETPRFHARDFLVEKLDENLTHEGKAYNYRARWLLIPKIFGHLRIPPQTLTLYRTDPETFLSRAQEIRSTERILPVSPLPAGVDFVGDLRMSLTLDRNRTDASGPVTAVLRLRGKGDLRRLHAPDLNLSGVLLYAGTPRIRTGLLADGSYGGSYIRSYTILADRDFTLPALRFRYLNSSTDTIEILQTPPRTVHVDNPALRSRRLALSGAFFAGAFLGGLATLLALLLLRRRRHALQSSEAKKILRASDRELYRLLLPYAANAEIARYIAKLEGNLYRKEKNPIERNTLARLVEEIRKSRG